MVRCACGAPGGAHAYPDRGFESDLRQAGLADAGLAFEEHERASTPRCRLDGRPGRTTHGGDPLVPRRGQTATMPSDGNVLVVGGRTIDRSGGKPSGTAELYEPLTDSWPETTPTAIGRDQHAAVLLLDGRVPVVGGEKDFLSMNWLASSELDDPGDLAPHS
jgi:hypothetical protein